MIEDNRMVNHVATLPTDTRQAAARVTLKTTPSSTARTFEALDYSWDASLTGLPFQSISGSGKVATPGFTLTKAVDDDSNFLWTLFLSARHLASMVIEVLAPNGTTAVRFTLDDVVVSQMTFSGNGVDANVPTDELLVNSQRSAWRALRRTARPLRARGTTRGTPPRAHHDGLFGVCCLQRRLRSGLARTTQ